MLPTKNRFNLATEVRKSKNKKIVGKNVNLTLKKTEEDFKATVIVPKKAAKRAVDRNRIKRTMREAAKELNIKNGNLAVFVKNNISNLKKNEIKKTLENLINK